MRDIVRFMLRIDMHRIVRDSLGFVVYDGIGKIKREKQLKDGWARVDAHASIEIPRNLPLIRCSTSAR